MKQGFVLSHLGRRPRTGEERRIPRSSRVKGVVKWLLASFLGDSEVGEEAGLRPCLTEGSPGGKKKKKKGSPGGLKELAVSKRPSVGSVASWVLLSPSAIISDMEGSSM